jgi:NAD(P)-dependent dehydrogenase (short-subunit alcohol dehydrogenase family)
MRSIFPSIKDKIVLVTGANHGIGAATAERFASQGAKVFLTFFREPCEYSPEELSRAREEGIGGALLHRAHQQQTPERLMHEYTQRFLKRNGETGRIVNVSTDAAHAHERNVSYAASKHAIESYSRSAAAELGKYGITVNIVAPGPIQTGYITPEDEKQIVAGTPLRRVGTPEDVADVVVFLASEQARWLTGQLIYVGGGWRMHQ